MRRALAESKATGKHIELFTQILDLRGLSSASQRALKYTKAIFGTDAAYYPERLGDLYVVNAPWVSTPPHRGTRQRGPARCRFLILLCVVCVCCCL